MEMDTRLKMTCVMYMYTMSCSSGMLRPGDPCGFGAKSFGLSLGLTLSRLCLDLGLMTSGLGLIEIGLVASNIYRLTVNMDRPPD